MVNVKRLHCKMRKDTAKGRKATLSTPEPGLIGGHFPPISSLAMVANCMFDVPS